MLNTLLQKSPPSNALKNDHLTQSCQVEHVKFLESINQGGYPRLRMVAPLNGPNSASGAICRTTKYTVYANEITAESSFWRRQAQISGPCVQHFSDSHQNHAFFAEKYKINQIP